MGVAADLVAGRLAGEAHRNRDRPLLAGRLVDAGAVVDDRVESVDVPGPTVVVLLETPVLNRVLGVLPDDEVQVLEGEQPRRLDGGVAPPTDPDPADEGVGIAGHDVVHPDLEPQVLVDVSGHNLVGVLGLGVVEVVAVPLGHLAERPQPGGFEAVAGVGGDPEERAHVRRVPRYRRRHR